MKDSRRSRWSFAAAVVAHAGAIAWSTRARPPQRVEAPPVTTLDVEVSVEPPPPSPPEPAPEPPSPPPPSAPRADVATNQPAAVERHSGAAEAVAEAPAAPAASAQPMTGSEGSWTFSPVAPGAGTATAPGQGEEAARAQATAAAVGTVIAAWEAKAAERARKPKLLSPRDYELGLVPGGQYVSITRDRVRSSTVPVNGHALLEFWTDKRGLVARVRVLDASSDRRAWDAVADALAEDARTAFPLKIPSNADGLIITLDVTSVLKTVSGAFEGQSGLAKAFDAVRNPTDAILDSHAVPQRVVAAKVVGVDTF